MDDLKKLREYLENVDIDNDVDSESIDSDELIVDSERLKDFEENGSIGNFVEVKNEIAHASHQVREDNVSADVSRSEDEINAIDNCCSIPIKNALVLNRKKRLLLENIAVRLHKQLSDIQTQIRNSKFDPSVVRQSHRIKKCRLGMPYFKDQNMFPCPLNMDYQNMKRNNELPLQCYFTTKRWTKQDQKNLTHAVYSHICQFKKKDLENQIENLGKFAITPYVNYELNMLETELGYINDKDVILSIVQNWHSERLLDETGIIERKIDIQQSIADIHRQILQGSDNALSKTLTDRLVVLNSELESVDAKNYIIKTVVNWRNSIDWLKISSINFQGRHIDTECSTMWNCYVNPKINKKPFTDSENLQLKRIVQRNKFQNWNAIADELNNAKSPYQCCIHFYSKIWEKFKRDRWTPEEELFLKEVVEICRVGSFIPWGRVALYFKDRLKSQIYNHYIYCMSPHIIKGRFTIPEDILFLTLLQRYKTFSRVSYYFPNRTIMQLRDRYKSIGVFSGNRWAFEDDMLILEHVEQNGDRDWGRVNLKKSASCIRHRYNVLQKWILQNPGRSVRDVPRRAKNDILSDQQQHRIDIINQAVTIVLQRVQHTNNPHSVLNIRAIEKLVDELNQYTVKPFKKKKRARPPHHIDHLIVNFFRPTYRFPGRSKLIVTGDTVENSTDRVLHYLKIIGANLNIPDHEDIENNPLLDELDRQILTRIKSNQPTVDSFDLSMPGTSRSNPSATVSGPLCTLPPNPESLIGFRGLLLHHPTLKKHSKTNETAYNYTTYPNGITLKEEIPVTCVMPTEQVLKERQIFRERFNAVFKWPAIMSLPYNAPPANGPFLNETVNGTESVGEGTQDVASGAGRKGKGKKRNVGRPQKMNDKVKHMLEAKRRKHLLKQETNSEHVSENEECIRIKLDQSYS